MFHRLTGDMCESGGAAGQLQPAAHLAELSPSPLSSLPSQAGKLQTEQEIFLDNNWRESEQGFVGDN